jgi:hypothetical protein
MAVSWDDMQLVVNRLMRITPMIAMFFVFIIVGFLEFEFLFCFIFLDVLCPLDAGCGRFITRKRNFFYFTILRFYGFYDFTISQFYDFISPQIPQISQIHQDQSSNFFLYFFKCEASLRAERTDSATVATNFANLCNLITI